MRKVIGIVVGAVLLAGRAALGGLGEEIEGMRGEAEVSVWVGGAEGAAVFEREAARVRPTASAVKTFFLVELFAKYEGKLDEVMQSSAGVLADDSHLAISHFTAGQREEIRKELGGRSVRYVARAMMGKEKVSNVVYNAAANLVMAELGGPEGVTGLIHKRDAAFSSIIVRRYMLRDRKTSGDNVGAAEAFAALYQGLASKKLAVIDDGTMAAVRECLDRGEVKGRGRRFDKPGDLQSDPLTAVRAGWWETAKGAVVYVAMVEQGTPGKKTRGEAGAAVAKLSEDLAERLLREGLGEP